LQISEVQLQRMVEDEELATLQLEDSSLVADAAAIVEEGPPEKIGFEDFDPSKELNDAAQNLPADETVVETATEPATEANADVVIEAIHQ
jgi:hypothetical protein